MKDNILVLYKSVTGFTKEYAQMIADEVDGILMDFKDISVETISKYSTIVFGGRFHAGTVDGLKKAKELVRQSKIKNFVIFATGATPNTAKEVIQEAWNRNLSPDELKNIPHFYMQSGLRYERMPWGDKLMMKVFCTMMKKKKHKEAYEKEVENAISSSYDISSRDYIEPLVSFLKNK